MGNPSDGFYGKTIALSISNFWADVTIYESAKLVCISLTKSHFKCRTDSAVESALFSTLILLIYGGILCHLFYSLLLYRN